MDTSRRVLIRAICYLVIEMLFLIIAALGESQDLSQLKGTSLLTYGGLVGAAFSAWMSYTLFNRWFVLREERRQLEEITHGST